jgi:hypothetical protein
MDVLHSWRFAVDAHARELAQAVRALTDDLNRKEFRVIKALSNRRRESDR